MKYLAILFFSFILIACGENNNAVKSHETHDPAHRDTGRQSSKLMLVMHRMDATMQNAEVTGIPEVDFATLMKIHHESAVEMADIELAEGKDTTVRALAAQIKKDQLTEISIFDSLLKKDNNGKSSPAFAEEFKKSIGGMDHGTGSQPATIDIEFLQLMIPHHEGAIKMAEIYLPYATDPLLKKTAERIIGAQHAEIELMKSMLARSK